MPTTSVLWKQRHWAKSLSQAGVRNLPQTLEKRSASVNRGEFAAKTPEGYVSVHRILVSAGMAEMMTK